MVEKIKAKQDTQVPEIQFVYGGSRVEEWKSYEALIKANPVWPEWAIITVTIFS